MNIARTLTSTTALALLAPVLALSPGGPAAQGAEAADPVPVRSHAYSYARSKEVVETRVLGRSPKGRQIVAYRKGNPAASRTIVVLGQMHGDETAGAQTARFIRDELAVDSDVDLWIVPTMNPDGAALGTRKNARKVDLNRNWPTAGWVSGPSSSGYYGGPRPASEPETTAMVRFLADVRPEYVTSLHQPFGAVGRTSKLPAYVDRLAYWLRLPQQWIGAPTAGGGGGGSSSDDPTLTSWYNKRYQGVAVTVELPRHPSTRYRTWTAGTGILKANRADW